MGGQDPLITQPVYISNNKQGKNTKKGKETPYEKIMFIYSKRSHVNNKKSFSHKRLIKTFYRYTLIDLNGAETNCGIAHILGILLVITVTTFRYFKQQSTAICHLSSLN